jgi:hypothetical protein
LQTSGVGLYLRDDLRDEDAIGRRSRGIPHVLTVGMDVMAKDDTRDFPKSQEQESQIHAMRLPRRKKTLAERFSRMDRIRDYALPPNMFRRTGEVLGSVR